MREKFQSKQKVVVFRRTNTVRKATKLYGLRIRALSFVLLTPFPWRETQLFTRHFEVQIGKKYFIHNIYKGKVPTLVGNRQLSVHLFFHRRRVFQLATEKLGV